MFKNSWEDLLTEYNPFSDLRLVFNLIETVFPKTNSKVKFLFYIYRLGKPMVVIGFSNTKKFSILVDLASSTKIILPCAIVSPQIELSQSLKSILLALLLIKLGRPMHNPFPYLGVPILETCMVCLLLLLLFAGL